MRRRPAVVVFFAVMVGFCASARAQMSCPPNTWTPPPPRAPFQDVNQFEQNLLNTVQTLCYRTQPGWAGDLAIRGTGPFVQGNLGTHYASVRIWYSKEVVDWLNNGRKGDIPDGAVIIKEQYSTPQPPENASWSASVPPACFQYMDEKTVSDSKFLADWSIMIRNKQSSKDGWYWIEVYKGMVFDGQNKYENQYPSGGYGNYCARCHASAESNLTFSSLENIKNQTYHNTGADPANLISGPNYLTFYTDQSWRNNPWCEPQSPANLPSPAPPLLLSHPSAQRLLQAPTPLPEQLPEPIQEELRRTPSDHERHEQLQLLRRRLARLAAAPPLSCPIATEQCMVPEVYDRVVSPASAGGGVGPDPSHPGWFVSSDQCQSCHSSSSTWMSVPLPAEDQSWPNYNVNVSPYAEWRWSPMGLAGRDPVFYSQVESELTSYIAKNPKVPDKPAASRTVKNTCFHCHGVMGQRQFALDHGKDATFDPGFVNLYPNPDNHASLYGSLARDGISCSVCHRIKEDYASLEDFLRKETTGNFDVIGGDIQGPFEDKHIVVDPMKDSVGYTPKHNAYTTSSRLCGSCHVIDLQVIDSPHQEFSLEQNTYVEWLNSQYENEFNPKNPKAQTCQDCHMRDSYSSAKYHIGESPLKTKMANIEDEQFPATTERLPLDKITVTYRSTGFRRHDLFGLNGFLLEMFNSNMVQSSDNAYYNPVLGVRQSDYMSGQTNDLPNAIDNIVQQARENTARVGVQILEAAGQQLTAVVTVQNLTGHRFPSGVGFRRAFLEFLVKNNQGQVIWASGKTDQCGEIVDQNGNVLPTEYFVPGPLLAGMAPCGNTISRRPLNVPGNQPYQHHYSVQNPITSQSQVQIYEELVTDVNHKITTSFLLRDDDLKDNRILPTGWQPAKPANGGSANPCATQEPIAGPIPKKYMCATQPIGTGDDPSYKNGLGQSTVRYRVQLPQGVDAKTVSVTATLYYQTIPPYFLRDRLQLGAGQPATERLLYLVNKTQLDADFANWKLEVDEGCAPGVCPLQQALNIPAAPGRGGKLALETADRGHIVE